MKKFENKSNHINYRKDIDGLRAVAVLSVLLFHIEINFFSGGFLGVDIFFVISGYLISSQIITNYKSGSFSFLDFYKRRVRRLFPAFIITILFCIILSSFIFVDIHYKDLKASALYAILGISNIYFWINTDYFGINSIFRPLLHIWSLSVEEQFYLIWPITLLLAFKILKEKSIIFLSTIFILSLIISEIYAGRPAGFYLPFFRFFEFIIGYLIFFFEKKFYKKNIFLYYLGFIILMFSIFLFSSSTSIPGINSLFVCIGTSFMIFFYDKDFQLYKLLTNNVIVFIGKISYSLYLIHWPIYVFYSYTKLGQVSFLDKTIVVIISFILSIIMYTFIEQTFRKEKIQTKYRIIFYWSSIFACLFLIFSKFSIFTKSSDNFSNTVMMNLENHNIVRSEKVKQFKLSNEVIQNKKNIILLGRSHAEDIWLSFKYNENLFSEYNFIFYEFDFRCFVYQKFKDKLLDNLAKNLIWKSKNNCANEINDALAKLSEFNYDRIIFSPRWSKAVNLEDIYKTFIQYEKKIIYMNRTPSFVDIPTLFLMSKNKETFREKYLKFLNHEVGELNIKIKNFVDSKESYYFDRYSLVCPNIKNCSLLSDDHLLITDQDHYSIEGFKLFGKKMFKYKIQDLF